MHQQIFAPGHGGVFRKSVDLGKIAQVFQSLFTAIDAHGVENIAGDDQNFPTNNFVLGAGVADDIHPLNERPPAFVHGISQIDYAGSGWNALREELHVHITAGAVSVCHRLRVIMQRLG